jgi:hypothetical protein
MGIGSYLLVSNEIIEELELNNIPALSLSEVVSYGYSTYLSTLSQHDAHVPSFTMFFMWTFETFKLQLIF